MKKVLHDYNLKGKKVLVRLDLNVPIKDDIIESDLRIKESLPTLHYLIDQGAKIIIVSHLGRPDGEKNKKYSLKPVASRLLEFLPNKVSFCDFDIKGAKIKKEVDKIENGKILVLENIRFYKEEEQNDEEFSKKLAELADVFVMDAFGTAHREHCSTYGVAKFLPSCMGFLMQKEIENIVGALENPQRPFIAILGGAKIKDKIKVVENLINKVDVLLIGGGMSYTFLKALKANVGKSIVQEEYVDSCYQTIKKAIDKNVKILLPVDHVCVKNVDCAKKDIKIFKNEIPQDYMAVDIGPKTIKMFAKQIKRAKTIMWNGPMGIFENANYENGTKQIALCVVKNKKVRSVVGGGDTVLALETWKLQNKVSHLSTGGGASLKLLEGNSLPGLDILTDK